MGKKNNVEVFLETISKFKKIAIDTSCFIYAFEQHPQFEPFSKILFNLAGNEKISLITSIITVTEVLVKPQKEKDKTLEELYFFILRNSPNLEIQDLGFETAVIASKIKAKYNVRLPDAFQLSIGILNNAQAFICNDKRLKRVKEIKVLVIKDFVS